MTEVWKPVVEHEGKYEVSDLGRVRSLDRRVPYRLPGFTRFVPGTLLRQSPSGFYLTVRLCGRTHMVHGLVLQAFVGPRPTGLCACHGPDFDGTNNKLTNLRWGTYTENNAERTPFVLNTNEKGQFLPSPSSRRQRKIAERRV